MGNITLVIASLLVAVLASGAVGFAIGYRLHRSRMGTRARELETQTTEIVQRAENDATEIRLKAKDEALKVRGEAEAEAERRLSELNKENQRLIRQREDLHKKYEQNDQ